MLAVGACKEDSLNVELHFCRKHEKVIGLNSPLGFIREVHKYAQFSCFLNPCMLMLMCMEKIFKI